MVQLVWPFIEFVSIVMAPQWPHHFQTLLLWHAEDITPFLYHQ